MQNAENSSYLRTNEIKVELETSIDLLEGSNDKLEGSNTHDEIALLKYCVNMIGEMNKKMNENHEKTLTCLELLSDHIGMVEKRVDLLELKVENNRKLFDCIVGELYSTESEAQLKDEDLRCDEKVFQATLPEGDSLSSPPPTSPIIEDRKYETYDITSPAARKRLDDLWAEVKKQDETDWSDGTPIKFDLPAPKKKKE